MTENPLDRIQSYYEDLTKTDLEIAIYCINNPHDVATFQADRLAKSTGTSKAAISRFCQRVGYTGYSEFKYAMARFLASRNIAGKNPEDADPVSAIIDMYSEYVLKMKESVHTEQVNAIARMFLKADKVKIFGINRSHNTAQQMRQRLAKLAFDAEASSDSATIADSANVLGKKDLAIIFTTTDNMHFYGPVVRTLTDHQCPFAVITMNPNLPFRKYAAQYVVLPRISKEASISFLDDQPLMMIFVELLVSAIAELSARNT